MYRIGSLIGVTTARNLRAAAAVAGAAAAALDAAAIILQDVSSPPKADGHVADDWDRQSAWRPLRVVAEQGHLVSGLPARELEPHRPRPAIPRPVSPIREARAHLTALSQLPSAPAAHPSRRISPAHPSRHAPTS